jgi:hypothetical protein
MTHPKTVPAADRRLPYLIREVRPGDLSYIASRLRPADARELEAVYGAVDFLPRLEITAQMSDTALVLEVKGNPVAAFGFKRFMADTAAVWCVASDALLDLDRRYIRVSRAIVQRWFKVHRNLKQLFNFVSAEGVGNQAWLAALGADLSQAVPMGDQGRLFHKFTICRER